MFDRLLALIAPHLCISCSKEGELLCGNCVKLLQQAPLQCYRCGRRENLAVCKNCQPLTAAGDIKAAVVYDAQARVLIHKLKFKRAAAAARYMARIMAPALIHVTEAVITYVPTATSRVRKRGYDQSSLIARELARQLSLPYQPLLLRHGQSRQVGQMRDQRRAQVRTAFQLRKGASLANQHYILVDDVITTGSTIEAAAEVLKHAGATKITAAVFAVRIK